MGWQGGGGDRRRGSGRAGRAAGAMRAAGTGRAGRGSAIGGAVGSAVEGAARRRRAGGGGSAWGWVAMMAGWVTLATLAGPAPAQDQRGAWHADQWPLRAVVEVGGDEQSVIDVGAVRVTHAGAAQGDADDYRVYDDAGRPQPYQVDYHHGERDTLIRFRAVRRGRYYVYFGNAAADRDGRRVVAASGVSGAPKPGPAGEGWLPRAGLVLTTMRRPVEAANPETVEAMGKLIDGSPGLDGAGYRTNIRDGVNPFGDSDHYISVYRGWLRLPKGGVWGFCTASNEASFSFIDGEPLVHWPGRHTEKRGERGQKNAERELEAGLHHVTYLHEEVLLYQVAFLGWRPPGERGFVKIPERQWPQPRPTKLVRYQRPDGERAFMPTAELIDSVWPERSVREAGQYTRMRFSVGGSAIPPRDLRYTWQFGDGQTATGATVDHVYLTTGAYRVTLTVEGEGWRARRTVPVTVFPVEHLTREGGFVAGRYADYTPIVKGYEAAKLGAGAKLALAHFRSETGDLAGSRAAAEAFIAEQRDGGASTAAAGAKARIEARLLAAGRAGSSAWAWRQAMGSAAARAAADHLQAAAALAAEAGDEATRAMIEARRVRHLGVEMGEVEAAKALHAALVERIAEGGLSEAEQAARRAATVALGDAYLAAGRFDAARASFNAAEALAARPAPRAVRVAKIGRYPDQLDALLADGDVEAAAVIVNQWLTAFPGDRMRGEPLFYAGKLALAERATEAAARTLGVAIDLGEGAAWESEARWRLAEAYGRAGEAGARRAMLEALARSGIDGRYRDKALAELRGEDRGDGETP